MADTYIVTGASAGIGYALCRHLAKRNKNVVAIAHSNDDLGFVQIQRSFKKYNKHIDVEISAKFLTWLLLDAENSFYTGDTIGIYNQKYQPLWHDSIIPSPYPDHVVLP